MFWPMVGRVYEQSHQTDLQFYFAQHVEPLVVENMALLQLLTSQQLVISIDFMQPYGYFSRPLPRVIILYLYWGGDWVSKWMNFILKLVIRHFNMTRVLHVHVVVLHCTSIFLSNSDNYTRGCRKSNCYEVYGQLHVQKYVIHIFHSYIE